MKRLILIITLVLLIISIFWYLGFQNKNKPDGQNSVVTTFKSFFPIGNNGANNPDENIIENENNVQEQGSTTQTSSFKQITRNPVAGFSIFSKTTIVKNQNKTQEATTDNFLRYVSRQSGYVYEIKNDSTPLQISNIFVPAIYESYFVDDNNSVILRFLKDDGQTIGSYIVPIPNENPDGTRTQKEGIFIADNIKSVSVSPAQKEFIRLTTDANFGTLTTSDTVDKNKKELFRSPLKEWLVSWPKSDTVYIQTKPAGIVDGFLYKIDLKEKKPRKILGGVKGLTTSVSPSGSFILYSESAEGGFLTKIFNTKNLSTRSLGLSILPEKCTWLKNEDLICAGNTSVEEATYPDSWYAGIVGFEDQIFRIYTQSNTFDVLDQGERGFDITNLQVDETNGLLYFINKKDGLLWQFNF
ncbi:MAG TPA: hypothetical protein PLQ20_00510 [Candidatus Paceibacterota bacterium]|nr:hypothetical protein [Candidatus Paceibacterota bacterium]